MMQSQEDSLNDKNQSSSKKKKAQSTLGPKDQEMQGVENQSEKVELIVRPLKLVQEEYQRFTQLKQRGGGSASNLSSGSADLTNPGTEVYAVDFKWIDQWKQLAQGSNQQNSAQAISQLKVNSQTISKDQIQAIQSPIQPDVTLTPLTNSRIIIPQNQFLTCSDPNNPYNNILREDIQAGKDYQLLSRDQWQIVETGYTQKGQVYPIRRYYEKTGMGIRTFADVFYHKFEVCFFNPMSDHDSQMQQTYEMYFSKKRTWDEMKLRIIKILKDNPAFSHLTKQLGNLSITKDHLRLWSCSLNQVDNIQRQIQARASQMNDEDQPVAYSIKGYCLDSFINHSIDQILCDGKNKGNQEASESDDEKDLSQDSDRDIILIELCNMLDKKQFLLQVESGCSGKEENLDIVAQCQYCFKVKQLKVRCKCMSVSYCSSQCQQNDIRFHQEKCSSMETIEDWDMICVKSPDARMGLTGLKNLKNSCYMSSSIQCLSHAIGLTNYFLLGHFKSELNYKNPLGAKGQLAIAYGKLLKQLWYDEKASLAPWQFKKTIAKFASNFNNFEQQDSQELLNFMLDGLHEDLNRVQHKPIVPQIESEGFNDEKDAEDSWQNHLKRNQSIIVDLMHGQFKSTVKCPDCEKLSITFDPFMSVSLPIPEIKIVDKTFYWVPYDSSKPCIQDNFKFKSLEQIKTLRRYIATSFDVHQEQFELVVIQDDRVKRILPRYEQMSSLNVNNIFIFAMETPRQSFQSQAPHKSQSFIIQNQSSFQLQGGDQWNEKKGANELSKKLKQSQIQVILNFQVFNQPGQSLDEEPESFFPRMVYLKLEESLIQAHLDIFEYLKPLFTLYLEHKEGLSRSCKKFFLKRKRVPVPERVKTSLWNNMTLVQQYEAVFGPMDPSRRKREDLPYFISIISRQDFGVDRGRCVYCSREECTNCPLPFEEMTLRDYLNNHGVATQSYFYYEDHQHKQLVASSNKFDKKKGNGGPSASSANLLNTPSKRQQANNLEFELQITFNANKCWALFENMVRSRKYAKCFPDKAAERQNQNLFQNDKVTIDDCFRQFMTPEKLSHQNTWFCSRCKLHKQAVKKFQIFKTPPILIINLKRFKGMQQKQNTLVHFPLEGLDMSNFVISQRQKDTEPLIYDLFGVSNHQGQLAAGHYTAFAKNDGTWYKFNDDEIEDVENTNQIVSNLAYNLFYARRDIDFSKLDYKSIRNILRSSQEVSNQSSQSLKQNLSPEIKNPIDEVIRSITLKISPIQQQLLPQFQNASDDLVMLPIDNQDQEERPQIRVKKHWDQSGDQIQEERDLPLSSSSSRQIVVVNSTDNNFRSRSRSRSLDADNVSQRSGRRSLQSQNSMSGGLKSKMKSNNTPPQS